MDNSFLEKLDFDPEIPTVLIETEHFTGEAVEMYELPSGMVMDMLAQPGAIQLNTMFRMLQLALLNPEDEEILLSLSFNQLTEVLFQWYTLSPVRVTRTLLPKVSLRDILGPSEDERRERRIRRASTEENYSSGDDIDGPIEDSDSSS